MPINDTYRGDRLTEIGITIAVDTWALIGPSLTTQAIVGTGTAAIVETLPCTDTDGSTSTTTQVARQGTVSPAEQWRASMLCRDIADVD
jgi:hypothetical protein